MTELTTGVLCRSEAPTAWERWADRLALFFLCVYTAECAVGCSGRWLEIGPLSIRMVLFAACLLLTLPRVIRELPHLIRLPYFWCLVAFAAVLAVAAVIGLQNGNNRGFIVADLTSLLSFALIPGFFVTIHTRERLKLLTQVLFFSAAALALVTVVLHFVLAFLPTEQITALNNWINQYALGGFATMPTSVQRIYLRSQIFLQVALLIGIWLLKVSPSRRYRLVVWAAQAILAFSLVLTYTRGFWLGLALSFVVYFVVSWREWRHVLKCVGVLILTTVVFFGASWAAYRTPIAAVAVLERFDPSLIVILPPRPGQTPSTPVEDGDEFGVAADLRSKTLGEQLRLIRENPLIGYGLGKNLDGIRDDGKTEYMYPDLWMKTGLPGLLLFLASCFWYGVVLLVRTLRTPRGRRQELCGLNTAGGLAWVWVCGLLGVGVTSYFNPFLTTPMGILVVGFVAAAVLLTPRERRAPQAAGDVRTTDPTGSGGTAPESE